jgi:cyclic pyranopterin phosphate synthase
MLVDSFGRKHDYLRISLTDQCNFRCLYCMPQEHMEFMPPNELMQANEIFQIAKIFVELGVNKIRLTGGEPLIRKDIIQIVSQLATLPVNLTLTTNGYLIEKHLPLLLEAGIQSINISLDTLQANKFKQITQRDGFQKVWNAIQLLLQNNRHVKVNTVLMKDKNYDEILDFVNLSIHHPLHIRFIEFMPFTGNEWEHKQVVTQQEILDLVRTNYDLEKLTDEKHDTAKKYKIKGAQGTFAIITTMSEPFCGDCNRLRLTADGKIKNCLFAAEESHLLQNLRNGKDILTIIKQSIWQKKARQGGQFPDNFKEAESDKIINRSMISIGG